MQSRGNILTDARHYIRLVCNTVKLRGHPKAQRTKPLLKGNGGQGNDLGYGKNR